MITQTHTHTQLNANVLRGSQQIGGKRAHTHKQVYINQWVNLAIDPQESVNSIIKSATTQKTAMHSVSNAT